MGPFEVAVPQNSTPPSSKKQTEGDRVEEGTWGGVVPCVAKRMLEAKIWKNEMFRHIDAETAIRKRAGCKNKTEHTNS
jgi:hypothetical protein